MAVKVQEQEETPFMWRNPETGTEWPCRTEHDKYFCCALDHPKTDLGCKCPCCEDLDPWTQIRP